MARLAMISVLIVTLLAGCGQVIVFGHVVGDRPAPHPKLDSASTSEPAATTEAASRAVQPATPAAAPAAARSATASPAAAETQPPAMSPPVAHVVKSVSLVITSEATAKVTGDASRFNADTLLDTIKTELESRKLLDEHDPQASGTAEIVVDGLATRATTNAIVFGYKMLAGTLEGDIRVTGASDIDPTGSRIVAQSKLNVAVSGSDKNPLGPLYRRFAVLAADRLAGVASSPQPPTGIPHF